MNRESTGKEIQMEKYAISCAAGLALLTITVVPTTATAANDKAVENKPAEQSATYKKAQLVEQQAGMKAGAKGVVGMAGELGTGGNQSTEVRNWAAIDTNKDHYIQPEEMEKYLNESWASQKKAAQKAK
jgi:hypothetical protein